MGTNEIVHQASTVELMFTTFDGFSAPCMCLRSMHIDTFMYLN